MYVFLYMNSIILKSKCSELHPPANFTVNIRMCSFSFSVTMSSIEVNHHWPRLTISFLTTDFTVCTQPIMGNEM